MGRPASKERDKAKRRGLATYYTGMPCVHGHDCPRYTINSTCVECHKIKAAKTYKKNHLKLRKQRVDRYWRDPETARRKTREWMRNNPEKVKTSRKQQYAANPSVFKARAAKRRALIANAGTYTAEDIERLHKKQRRRCFYCHKKYKKKFHVDHYIPLAKFGSNKPKNLRIACPQCNWSKRDALPKDFIKRANGDRMRRQDVDIPIPDRALRAMKKLGWID